MHLAIYLPSLPLCVHVCVRTCVCACMCVSCACFLWQVFGTYPTNDPRADLGIGCLGLAPPKPEGAVVVMADVVMA